MKKQFIIAFILTIVLIPFSVWGWGIMGMSGGPGVDWDLLDEDCADFNNPTWTDDDNGTAVSEISPAGQFRFDTNTGAAGNAKARRYATLASCPNTFTYEIKVYADDIGARADNDHILLFFGQADERLYACLASDGIFLYDTDSNWIEVGTNLVLEGGSVEWQWWRFLVTFTGTTGDGTCDVYYKNETTSPTTWTKVGTSINCSEEGAHANGRIILRLYGYATNDMVSHFDYARVATGLYIP